MKVCLSVSRESCFRRSYHTHINYTHIYTKKGTEAEFIHLVLTALAGLKAGQDLALDHLHPGVSLLVRSGFEMPRLPRQRHDGELEVLLLFCWRESKDLKREDKVDIHAVQHVQGHSAGLTHSFLIGCFAFSR